MFNRSPSNEALVVSARKDLKNFLGKLEKYLKEMKIEDDQIINIVSLIEPIVEACQNMPKFSNCLDLKGKLAILAKRSGEAMMVFLGMLDRVMTKGDLLPQDKVLLGEIMGKISRVRFSLSK